MDERTPRTHRGDLPEPHYREIYLDASGSVSEQTAARIWALARGWRAKVFALSTFNAKRIGSFDAYLSSVGGGEGLDRLYAELHRRRVPITRGEYPILIITDDQVSLRGLAGAPANVDIIQIHPGDEITQASTNRMASNETAKPQESSMQKRTATVQVTELFVSRDVAAAEVVLESPEGRLRVESSAKRRHCDKPNADVGVKLALGRALTALGQALVYDALRISEEENAPSHGRNVNGESSDAGVMLRSQAEAIVAAKDLAIKGQARQITRTNKALLAEKKTNNELRRQLGEAKLAANPNDPSLRNVKARVEGKPVTKPANRTVKKTPAKKVAAKKAAARPRKAPAKRTAMNI